jgi:hypothetical protein
MKVIMIAGTILISGPALADGESARRKEVVFRDCSLTARHKSENGILLKVYRCGKETVGLTGKWSSSGDGYKEFGTFVFGETDDFGDVPRTTSIAFANCSWNGDQGNGDGYMTETQLFVCDARRVVLKGYWGEEYQGHWNYNLSLGEVDMKPQWVDNVSKNVDFTSSFQKWCPTRLGFKLCGSIDKPRVDHGSPPKYVRDNSR